METSARQDELGRRSRFRRTPTGKRIALTDRDSAILATLYRYRYLRPYFLYVDEFHSFTTSAFADVLSELRKYRMGLVFSTQFGSQLDDDVRDAVFGNVGTLVVFRVGVRDANMLVKQLGGRDVPSVRDLVNLPNYEMYVKLMVDGVPTRPFSARSLPPPG